MEINQYELTYIDCANRREWPSLHKEGAFPANGGSLLCAPPSLSLSKRREPSLYTEGAFPAYGGSLPCRRRGAFPAHHHPSQKGGNLPCTRIWEPSLHTEGAFPARGRSHPCTSASLPPPSSSSKDFQSSPESVDVE